MKVTAIIADDLIQEVRSLSKSATITEAITIALKDWIRLRRIKELNLEVAEKPLSFSVDTASIRELNRSS
jgi:hypothetical protein